MWNSVTRSLGGRGGGQERLGVYSVISSVGLMGTLGIVDPPQRSRLCSGTCSDHSRALGSPTELPCWQNRLVTMHFWDGRIKSMVIS